MPTVKTRNSRHLFQHVRVPAIFAAFVFLVLLVTGASVQAQNTGFTYQGSLNSSGVVANGNHDFEFALFDAVSGGAQLGSTITQNGVAVTNGTFAVSLDFGNQFPGAARFLEIRVRQTGGGAFTALVPRQSISSSPYAVKSLSAATADAVLVGGVPAGSGNYVQNTTTPQPSSNFNITGTGTANILNAATQFNLNGERILRSNTVQGSLFLGRNTGTSNTGASNIFIGHDTGFSNTSGFGLTFVGGSAGFSNFTGTNNSFFGGIAGRDTSTGSGNSFFGQASGRNNQIGSFNSFFGNLTGSENLTGGSNAFFGTQAGKSNLAGSLNSFFGSASGLANLSGNNLTLVGANSNVASDGLSFASAIGAGATVSTNNTVVLGRAADTVRIPGNLNVLGTASGNGSGFTSLNASNISTGTLDPARLGNGAILNQTGTQPTSNFNISGTGTANIFNATAQFNINGSRAFSTPSTDNVFAGILAGNSNSGLRNSFFGYSAGSGTTSGANNTFIGWQAGITNTTGSHNTLLGWSTSLGSNNLSFATAIGAGAVVDTSNTMVLGRSADTIEIPGRFLFRGDTDYSKFEFSSTTGSPTISLFSDNSLAGARFVGRRARGTETSPSAVQSGDVLFSIAGSGWYGGSVWGGEPQASKIEFIATENWSPTQNGSRIDFRLVRPGTFGNFLRAMTVTSNGIGIFNTAPTEALDIIDNGGSIIFGGAGCPSGSVAIGLNGPFSNCTNYTVRGTGTDLMFNRPTGGEILFRENNGNTQMRLRPGGVLQLATLGAAGATTLCRNASNDISTCSSSIRYKSNIVSFGSGLSLIRKLTPVSFTWKDGGMADMGLVAEDVAEIEPLLVTFNTKGEVEGVKYDRIGVVLVNAVKEQQAMIEALKAEVAALKDIACSSDPSAKICRK